MVKKKKQTEDFESRWAEENALKKLRKNMKVKNLKNPTDVILSNG